MQPIWLRDKGVIIMRALGYQKGSQEIESFDIAKPAIQDDHEVLFKIIQAGIDGTDRALVRQQLWDPPPGQDFMIIGHEVLGRVEQVGDKATEFKVGDYIVPTIRRGCGLCASCLNSHSDTCSTGLFTERGIHKLNGYFTEYAVDHRDYVVKVPEDLIDFAVLTEPLSIGEKAISQLRLIQSRLPWACEHPEHAYDKPGWAGCKKGLVIGGGPLGLMIAGLLRLQGIDTHVAEIMGEDTFRVKLIKEFGGHYIHSMDKGREEIEKETGPLDVIIEASGSVKLAMDMILALARNGIYVLTGLPFGVEGVCSDGATLLRQIVRYNQVIIGVVNSNRTHFESAIEDLSRLRENYGVALSKFITHRFPFDDYQKAWDLKDPNAVKVVMEME